MGFLVEGSDFSKVLVHFIAACAGSKACWYSLRVISNDVPNLPEVMGLSYSSMMYMFECCGLASRRTDTSEWNFLPMKFTHFMNKNDLLKVTDIITSKLLVADKEDNKIKWRKCWFL